MRYNHSFDTWDRQSRQMRPSMRHTTKKIHNSSLPDNFRRVILVKSALDVYTGPVPPNSLWHDERAVRDKFRIHYADLDRAVGSTRLFAVARNARVGFAKTLSAHDGRGNSGLQQEVADTSARRCESCKLYVCVPMSSVYP